MNERKKTILIVDDDRDIRLFLELALKKAGFEILQAANGAKALDVMRESPPDLIVTDEMMPVLDGYGLIEAVRKQEASSRIPIIMLTGQDSERTNEGTVRPDEYMKKPVSSADITGKIKEILMKTV